MENELGHIDENLLVKYLAGEATEAENQQLEEWLKEEENRKEFESLRSLWEETGEVVPLPEVDVDLAWAKVNERISQPQEPVIRSISEKRFEKSTGINWLLRVAAVIIPLAVISLAVWQYTVRNGHGEILVWETGTTSEYRIMPDGSKITLAAHSHFEYPEKFASKRRRVVLEGEAFFDIKRDLSRPFIVHTEEADVKVLGTKFNVNTEFEGEQTEVIVESGKVAFYLSDKEKKQYVELKRGEKAVLDKSAEKITKSIAVEVGYYWHGNKTLVFDETEMSKVVEVLNVVFGKNISIESEAVAQCRLSATFQDQDVESILAIIAETFGLEIRQTDRGPSIAGSDCEAEPG